MGKLKKIFLLLFGVIALKLNLYAGIPDGSTIIILSAEQSVKFEINGFCQNDINEVIYFKISANEGIKQVLPDFCGENSCNYTISKDGLSAGVYQIQVYIDGYNEPVTKSFVL